MGFESSSIIKDNDMNNKSEDGLIGVCDFYEIKLKCPWVSILNFFKEFKFLDLRNIKIKNILPCIFAKRTFSIAIVMFVTGFLFTFLLEETNVFGLDKALSDYSESVIDRIAAPFYESDAQKEIVVVLINDDTLTKQGTAWPPHYDWYSQLANRILKTEPKAVFFDIQFNNVRDDDKTLDKARAELQDDLAKYKVPLIFAQGLDTSRVNVFKGVSGVEFATVEWSGLGRSYPLLLSSKKPEESHTEEPCNPSEGVASPALQLYRIACSDNAVGCKESAKLLADEALCKPIAPHWGRAVSKLMVTSKLMNLDECDLIDPVEKERYIGVFSSLWNMMRSGISDNTRQRCPYTVSLYAHDLVDFEKVHDLLRGKIVIVGSAMPALHDLVTTPVHGQIPGVYVHAMVLDNLMAYGRNYYSYASKNTVDYILIALALLVSLITAASLRAKPDSSHIILRLFIIMIVAGLINYLYFGLHYPAANWLSFLLLYELVIQKNHNKIEHHND